MVKEWLRRLLTFEPAEAAPPVKPGLYHIMQETESGITRFHLRVDNDGSGILIANAMAAARLTPSGVLIAKGLLEGKAEAEILAELKRDFSQAKADIVHEDVLKVNALIEKIKAPGDTYPIYNLEDAAMSPRSSELIAPLQASVPLAEPAMLTPLLDRLWEVAIPHVIFLAAPGFDREDLIRAVEHAEDLGMIAGVRARATEIQDDGLLADLMQAGVDHITFLYAAHDREIHEALCGAGDLEAAHKVLDWLEAYQISAVAEIPLTQTTLDRIGDTVEGLIAKGADNLAFVAYATTDPEVATRDGVFVATGMAQVATTVEETASMVQALFIWDPPVERDPALTLTDQVLRGPRCSGDVAVRVEPTGEVIPPRGPYRSAGNLLHDSWDDIWNDPVFQRYRERVEAPTRCEVCPGLAICAADCPRNPDGWAQKA